MVPSEQIIDIGRKARLECLTEERDRGAIEWRKDGRALPAHVARLVATRNVLQIFNLQREDYGMYQCFVDRGRMGRTAAGAGAGMGNTEAQAGSELRLGGEIPKIEFSSSSILHCSHYTVFEKMEGKSRFISFQVNGS